jgi:hypothetical protein
MSVPQEPPVSLRGREPAQQEPPVSLRGLPEEVSLAGPEEEFLAIPEPLIGEDGRYTLAGMKQYVDWIGSLH